MILVSGREHIPKHVPPVDATKSSTSKSTNRRSYSLISGPPQPSGSTRGAGAEEPRFHMRHRGEHPQPVAGPSRREGSPRPVNQKFLALCEFIIQQDGGLRKGPPFASAMTQPKQLKIDPTDTRQRHCPQNGEDKSQTGADFFKIRLCNITPAAFCTKAPPFCILRDIML